MLCYELRRTLYIIFFNSRPRIRRYRLYNSSSSWYNIGMIIMGEFKLFLEGPGNKIKRPPTTCRRLKIEIRLFSFFSSLYIGEKEVFWFLRRNQIIFVLKLKRFHFLPWAKTDRFEIAPFWLFENRSFWNSGVFVFEPQNKPIFARRP